MARSLRQRQMFQTILYLSEKALAAESDLCNIHRTFN